MATTKKPAVFVVIPAYNESGAIEKLASEICSKLRPISSRFAVLFVDDGSKDDSTTALKRAATSNSEVSGIRLARNSGQTTAIQAGLDHIPDWAEIVVTMDSDGQDDPAYLEALFAPLMSGDAEMAIGWRVERAEKNGRVWLSRAANRMLSRATKVDVHDFGSPMKAMDANLARSLELRGDMHRFIPAMAALNGASVVEVEVTQRKRETGVSKYGAGRVLKVFLDMFALAFALRFAQRPFRLFGIIGLTIWLLGAVLIGLMVFEKIAYGTPMLARPYFAISVTALLSGLIVMMNGLLADLLSRSIYRGTKATRSYFIRSSVNGKGLGR